MPYIVLNIRIDFGGGQRSSEVVRGQRLKILFIQYLSVGTMVLFHTYLADAPYEGEYAY